MKAGAFTYRYARAALTVDCAVFAFAEGALHVLLIRRGQAPFEGTWALPGGFIEMDETVEAAARRELLEETGLEQIHLEELGTFSRVDRDPRERVISIAFVALLRGVPEVMRGSDAADARFFRVDEVPALAFDHEEILRAARARLRAQLRTRLSCVELLPRKFPLRDLQTLYESILGAPIDKRNFRKRMLAMGMLVPLGEREEGVTHRAAELYRFDKKRIEKLEKDGFVLGLG
jgi:8-oxo-dGTP diphosphatase